MALDQIFFLNIHILHDSFITYQISLYHDVLLDLWETLGLTNVKKKLNLKFMKSYAMTEDVGVGYLSNNLNSMQVLRWFSWSFFGQKKSLDQNWARFKEGDLVPRFVVVIWHPIVVPPCDKLNHTNELKN